MTAAGFKY